MNLEVGFRHLTRTHLAAMFRGGRKKNTICKEKKQQKNDFALNYLRAILHGVPALPLQSRLTSNTEEQNKLKQLYTTLTDSLQLAVELKFAVCI